MRDALTTVANLIISFSMWLMWLLHHVMIMTVSEVKLVLLVRRSGIEWAHLVLVLHMWMHTIHFFGSHAGTVTCGHSSMLTLMRMPATHTSCTSRRIIWNAVGSRVVWDLIGTMFRIIHLAWVLRRMVHVWRWASHHMWITSMVFMWHTVLPMRHIVMTLHNRIWIVAMTVMMLPVRTGIVHLAILILVNFSFANCRSGLTPMTIIWTVFRTDGCTHFVHSLRTVVNVILTTLLATSGIQICRLVFTMLARFLMIMLISGLVLFWSRFLLTGGWEMPWTMRVINHGWLINVIRIKFVLSERLHVVSKLTCNWRRPSIVDTLIIDLIFSSVEVIRVLNVFWRGRLDWLLLLGDTLDDSWRKLTSRWGRRLGSSSRVFWSVGSLWRLWFLELVPPASVVLRSISAFVCVHICLKCSVVTSNTNWITGVCERMSKTSKCIRIRTISDQI